MNILSYLFLAFAFYFTLIKHKEAFSFIDFLRFGTKKQKIEVFNTLVSKELAVFLVFAVIISTSANVYSELPKYLPRLTNYIHAQCIAVIIHSILAILWIVINRISYESKNYIYGNK